jgi:hypothetical protein
MAAGEDQSYTTAGDPRPNPPASLLRSAALAAGLLENACAPGSRDPLRLDVVRTLARDLKRELETLATLAGKETDVAWVEEVEGALRAADVANLAACTVPELLEARVPEVAAATHVAAGATRGLGILVQAGAEDRNERQAPYALKDARGAMWRARLAARQVDEFLGAPG